MKHTPEAFCAAFSYDEESGDLVWKMRESSSFASTRAYSTFLKRDLGRIAGSPSVNKVTGKASQITVCLDYKRYGAHNVIWWMRKGIVPAGHWIDHIDGNPYNNRLSNLRVATYSQNCQNRRKQSNNTSGYKGVSWNKHAGKWISTIRVNGKSVHLGLFVDIEEAFAAYIAASQKMHGEFGRYHD